MSDGMLFDIHPEPDPDQSPASAHQIDPEDADALVGISISIQTVATEQRAYVSVRHGHPVADRIGRCGRLQISIVVALLRGDAIPIGWMVDHINGNPMDNRRCNLRVTSPSINAQNKRGYGKSQYANVSFSPCHSCGSRGGRSGWIASIHRDGRYVYRKRFVSEVDAAAADAWKDRQGEGGRRNREHPNWPNPTPRRQQITKPTREYHP